jgi:hypothetical protein
MTRIRVPYPLDPEARRSLFNRVEAILQRHGEVQGTPEIGSFRGMTPVGGIAGNYRSPVGTEFLEIEVTEKPWLVPALVIEHEVRKFLTQN